ncbi:MAG: hypothetical protein AAF502_19675 [Bacteroidota bacterium]
MPDDDSIISEKSTTKKDSVQDPTLTDEPLEVTREEVRRYAHFFQPFDNDPLQEKTLRALAHGDKHIVTGANGTGKAHTLSAIVSNLLSQGKRCLVVGNNPFDLQAVKSQLSSIGLTELCLIISEPELERNHFIEEIKHNAATAKNPVNFDADAYDLLISLCLRDEVRLKEIHTTLNKVIYEDDAWAGMAGKFLESHHIQERSLLNSMLSPDGFTFSPESYELMVEAIQECERLYKDLNTLKHPLEALNNNIFQDNSEEEAIEHTEFEIQKFEQRAGNLYHRFIGMLENYRQELNNHYTDYYETLREKSLSIKAGIKDYSNQYGTDFQDADAITNTKLKLQGLFSKRPKNILETKKMVLEQYEKLKKDLKRRPYFEFSFDDIKSSGSGFEKINGSLEAFDESLKTWSQTIPKEVDNKVTWLNSTTVIKPLSKYQELVEELEKDYAEFVTEFNESELFEKQFTAKAGPLKEKLEFLSSVVDQIELIKYNLQDFGKFFPWKHYWLTISGMPQKLVEALIKVRPSNWIAAFESWFFHHLLDRNYDETIPNSGQLLHQATEDRGRLNKLMPKKILAAFRSMRNERYDLLKQVNKPLFNKLFSKKNKGIIAETTLGDLMQEDMATTTAFFPVLLMSPKAANNILAGSADNFDLVAFSDAGQMNFKDCVNLLNQADLKFLFANPHYSEVIASALGKGQKTLLQYGREMKFMEHNLPYYHHDMTPFVGLLERKVFNAEFKKLPKPEKIPEIRYMTVQGNYFPNKATNEEEAQQILALLSEVKPLVGKQYPAVGIVCFTAAQEELINRYFKRIKFEKQQGVKVIWRLEEAGMSVCPIYDLNQYAFDILFVSTVFDTSNNELTKDFRSLDRPLALCAFQDLLMYPAKQLTICTSIEPDFLRSHLPNEEDEYTGLHILADYLDLARDLSRFPMEPIPLPLATTYSGQESHDESRLLLIREIIESICLYIDPERVESHMSIGSVPLDLVIHPLYEKEPPIAIRCDGFFTSETPGAYLWDHQVETMLEEAGYYFIPIWSVNWWRQPVDETRQLVSEILELDQKYDREPRVIKPGLEENIPWDST